MDDFATLRPRLLGVSYRILGSWADAEDVVQESWIAWQGVDRGAVDSPVAYLTRTVGNRSLNRLRERTRRREDYLGPWLPEPVDRSRLPEEHSELADSLSYAMLVLLEQLSPLERAAFVLCEVFALNSTEAARALDSTPAAVRQVLSRARRHLRERDRSPGIDPVARRTAAADFVEALLGGDMAAAVSMLSPDVVLVSDGGGRVSAARRPIEGPQKVLAFLHGLAAKFPGFTLETRELNLLPAMIVHPGDELPTIFLIDLAHDGRIGRIWAVRNPDKTSGTLRN